MSEALNLFLCIGAFVFHFLEKWNEHREKHPQTGFVRFFHRFPAKHAMAIVGTTVAFAGTYAIEWMNPGMAIACGYMGDSLTRRIAEKFGSA